jgi:hypothetical protein
MNDSNYAQSMIIYALLSILSENLEKRLQQDKKVSSFSIETIPDDLRINVVAMLRIPVKHIKCIVNLDCP